MAFSKMAAEDPELSDDVVEEVKDAEDGAGEGPKGEEPRETIRLSRYKRKEQEREEREAALKAERDERAAETERLRAELAQTRELTARLHGAVEQMQRQPREAQQQRQTVDEDTPMSLRDKIDERRRVAQEALGKSDLDAYQREMEGIMELKARAIVAAQPRQQVQAQQPQQVQKPDWVRAVEWHYPDILAHPRGQHTVGVLDSLATDPWGPERLHRAFQRARTELGIKPAVASAPASRGLYTSMESTATGGRSTRGETSVSIPKKNLEEMLRAGLTRAQAAKAWKESYPEE